MALRELTVRVAGHLGDEPTTVVTLSFARESRAGGGGPSSWDDGSHQLEKAGRYSVPPLESPMCDRNLHSH